MVELHTYSSMDKQYMEGRENVVNTAMWLTVLSKGEKTTPTLFKEQSQKEAEIEFLGLSCDLI